MNPFRSTAHLVLLHEDLVSRRKDIPVRTRIEVLETCGMRL